MKKKLFPGNEKTSPIFSRIIEHKNCQWTIYKGPQCFSTSVVQSIWSFFVGPKISRAKFSKINLSSRRKQRFWPIFSPITHYDRHWVFFLLGSTGYLDNHGANYKIFSLGPKRLFKTHIFWKKSTFSVKKCICPIFVRIVECGKPQETIYKSQKDILTINVEVKRPFFRTLDVVDNTNFGKKTAIFPMVNFLRQTFIVISTLTDLREQLKKVHKVFWNLLWKILDHFCGI